MTSISMRRAVRGVTLACALGILASTASAQCLYAADGAEGRDANNLMLLDPATGALLTTIGTIGMSVTGLAFDPITGILYASTGSNGSVQTDSIITVNPGTGLGTLVGPTTGPMAGLSFDATGQLFGWSESGDDLYRIDKATGVATLTGNSGIGTSGSGTSFNAAGDLWVVTQGWGDRMDRIDPVTGTSLQTLTLSGTSAEYVNALTAHPVTDMLYGNHNLYPTSELITIDVSTGVRTVIGASPSYIDALTFGLDPNPPDLLAQSMAIGPASSLPPGSTFDIDVVVENTGTSPEMVLVDVFYGLSEPVPGLGSTGPMSTTISVPAMGTAMASFVGIAGPATAEVWRVHALVNGDFAINECELRNNVQSDTLCFADPAGCTGICGDCDENGVGVTITDALVAAQVAAAIVMPNPNQMCVCDVNTTGFVDIIDALLMAQESAGLMPGIFCGPGGVVPTVSITNTVGALFATFDICGDPLLDLSFEWSTDSGMTWAVATAFSGSPLASPAPATPAGLDYQFWWDSLADVPVMARPVMADFRINAYNPTNMTTGTATVTGLNLLPQPATLPYLDPVAMGHTVEFTPGTDDSSSDVTLPFTFPYWESTTSSTTTTTIGMGTNGGLRMTGGYTSCCSQPPLWTYSTGVPTIHAHGADGYTGNLYSYTDPTMAVFTWINADYCCISPGNWSVQVVLLPTGDFQIRQVQATTDLGRTITIGYSDGQSTDNSIPGATGIDWDTFPIGTPSPLGHVDIGSSEPGGMATGVVLYFEYDPAAGYTVYRLL